MPVPTNLNFYAIDDLSAALAEGSLVLTPNHRLARRIRQSWAMAQKSLGTLVWETPRVMSLDQWWRDCYRRCQLAGRHLPAIASEGQQAVLWRQTLERLPAAAALLRPQAAAELAQSAYQTLLLWNIDWRDQHVQQQFSFSEDSQLFVTWAAAFEAALEDASMALLPQILSSIAADFTEPEIVLAEFEEVPPLYEQLLRQQSGKLTRHMGRSQAAKCQLQPCDSHQHELEQAAAWALKQHKANPNARLGLLLPSLQQERAEIERILHRTFASDSRRPESLPVNFSAGVPLSTCPPVSVLLTLLRLTRGELSLDDIRDLVETRYRDGSCQKEERLALESLYRAARAPVSTGRLRAALQKAASADGVAQTPENNKSIAGPDIATPDSEQGEAAKSLSTACDLFADSRRHRERKVLSEWLPDIEKAMDSIGWPGEGPLDSLEYQQVAAFYSLLDDFTALEAVTGQVNLQESISHLEQLCDKAVFQAETPDAPIQVLGLLEGAGLQFDAVWMCGMAAGDFPAASSPSPFIPTALQRAERMPHADAARELRYAQGLLKQLESNTGILIASYARLEQDVITPPSPLIQHYPERGEHPREGLPTYWFQYATADIEEIQDAKAPALIDTEADEIRGGSAIVGDQAKCPFRAFARHRLKVQPIPELESGLTAAERGMLLHGALHAMWGVIGDSQTLQAMSEQQRADVTLSSAASAITEFRRRRDAVTLALLDIEQQRLQSLLLAWLDIEAQRPPFVVAAREQRFELEREGLRLRLQIDRIDELPSGGKLLIDYKSGDSRVGLWLGQRPEDPQLPLYAMTLPQDELVGLSFAVLRSTDPGYRGLAAEELGPGIGIDIETATAKTDLPAHDWTALQNNWQSQLGSLLMDFVSGEASVAPINRRRTCQYCGLEALCRVQ